MINLNEIEDYAKYMIEIGVGDTEQGASCSEVIELIERLRQAEKDAARYRWLLITAQLNRLTAAARYLS